MFARMLRDAPAASGIRSASRIPASGQNGSSRYVSAPPVTNSEIKFEHSSGLLIRGHEDAGRRPFAISPQSGRDYLWALKPCRVILCNFGASTDEGHHQAGPAQNAHTG